MRVCAWIMLVLLCGPGCLMPPFSATKDAKGRSSLSKIPPVPVTSEQINTENAHRKSLDLFDEMEWEDRHLAKNAK